MKRQHIKQRLAYIFGMAPRLQAIMESPVDVEQKRQLIRNWLSNISAETYGGNPNNGFFEYLHMSDAIAVFRRLISSRCEKLAHFSLLEYTDQLIKCDDYSDIATPKLGFFAELEHIIRAVNGKPRLYDETSPAGATHADHRKVPELRSTVLSRLARRSEHYMQQYFTGFENDAIQRRSNNKVRIMDYFGATELEWDDWRWQLRHVIRDAQTLRQLVQLSDTEYEACKLASELKIPFGITPYYLMLMDHGNSRQYDRAVRAQVIPSLHYVKEMARKEHACHHAMDFMLECDTSPIEGITRRYPNIVILKPVLTCPQICIYCQRNWQIKNIDAANATISQVQLDDAIHWIADNKAINEVLITGGDPFLLSNKRIESICSRIAAIAHVSRIRIGTRTLVTLPQRITASLVRDISRFHIPGKQEIIIMTHFEHPYEITPQAMAAVQRFRQSGIEVYNQLVYTYYNSRRFEAAFLRQKLRLIGVTPYYTFNTMGKNETNDFRVPIARLIQEQKEEARLLPGTVRTDEIVFNVPGLGKNYLKASQYHHLISILPDGRRVYEFHPWEKKLSQNNTYIYKDVSIYDYLKRLETDGENVSAYRGIWYHH